MQQGFFLRKSVASSPSRNFAMRYWPMKRTSQRRSVWNMRFLITVPWNTQNVSRSSPPSTCWHPKTGQMWIHLTSFENWSDKDNVIIVFGLYVSFKFLHCHHRRWSGFSGTYIGVYIRSSHVMNKHLLSEYESFATKLPNLRAYSAFYKIAFLDYKISGQPTILNAIIFLYCSYYRISRHSTLTKKHENHL